MRWFLVGSSMALAVALAACQSPEPSPDQEAGAVPIQAEPATASDPKATVAPEPSPTLQPQPSPASSSPPPPPTATPTPMPTPTPTPSPTPTPTVFQTLDRVSRATVRLNTSMGGGTGIIIDNLGYVLTANHVVQDMGAVTVVHNDGHEEQGIVLGRDEVRDLAVLKISGHPDLPVVEIGDLSRVQVGDRILAIGFPGFNEEMSTTSGVISAFVPHEIKGYSFIQTDAPFYPGLSGGPLFTSDGEVIGIINSTPALQAGYAIAIDEVALATVLRLKTGEMNLMADPVGLGSTKKSPAPLGHTVRVIGPPSFFSEITRSIHEISVEEVIRGERAAEIVAGAYEYNPPPFEGNAYVLARVKIRYIRGPAANSDWVHQVDFRVLSGQGVVYSVPFGVVPVQPFLSARLYPGSVFEAWTTWEIAEDDKAPLLVWGLDWYSRGLAFFALEELATTEAEAGEGDTDDEAVETASGDTPQY